MIAALCARLARALDRVAQRLAGADRAPGRHAGPWAAWEVVVWCPGRGPRIAVPVGDHLVICPCAVDGEACRD